MKRKRSSSYSLVRSRPEGSRDERLWYTIAMIDSYFAGLFDGEGCISINKTSGGKRKYKRYGFQLRTSVTNTNLDVLYKLQDTYGGKVYIRNKKNARDYGNWITVSNQCIKPLSLWLPHLIIKKNQALVALDFQKNRKTNKTDEEWQEDMLAYEEIRKLNARYGSEYYQSS